MGRLFGTDGVRGVANQDLTPELAFRLGRATAAVLGRRADRPRVLVGKDTRLSGDMLECALSAGLMSAGAEVWQVGVLPTAGVAYLTRTLDATAGVMISASHNPVADNGIKVFSSDGFKLEDAVEDEIEALVRRGEDDGLPRPVGPGVGRLRRMSGEAHQAYVRHVAAALRCPFAGHVVIDAAYGAATAVVHDLVREAGLRATVLHGEPDGERINVACGATHPAPLQHAVRELGADVGLALDGDADRLIAVDEQGEVVDGDRLLVLFGTFMHRKGLLRGGALAVTAMSNLGLHECLSRAGIRVVETRVGDRYVLEAMRQQGLCLGGEQSGHILFLDDTTTGDGLLTGMKLLTVLAEEGLPLSRLARRMRVFPQRLVNVRVVDKEGWEEDPAIARAIEEARERLEGRGRILVRASGTEALIRVMVEGPDGDEVDRVAEAVAAVIARARGVDAGV